jgi:hypothetical protein
VNVRLSVVQKTTVWRIKKSDKVQCPLRALEYLLTSLVYLERLCVLPNTLCYLCQPFSSRQRGSQRLIHFRRCKVLFWLTLFLPGVKVKAVLMVLNSVPCHEEVLGSLGIAPRILGLGFGRKSIPRSSVQFTPDRPWWPRGRVEV